MILLVDLSNFTTVYYQVILTSRCFAQCHQLLISFFMVSLQSSFFHFLAIEYGLAMSSTAVAVLLGCAVEDPKMATEFLPLLFVPQLLFAGFFVRTELIPVWLRWAQYLCSLTYGVRLALLAEFGE